MLTIIENWLILSVKRPINITMLPWQRVHFALRASVLIIDYILFVITIDYPLFSTQNVCSCCLNYWSSSLQSLNVRLILNVTSKPNLSLRCPSLTINIRKSEIKSNHMSGFNVKLSVYRIIQISIFLQASTEQYKLNNDFICVSDYQ